MRALLLLTLICSHVTAIVPLYAATYKGTITIEVGELQKYDIGYGYMGSNITVSGFWSKSNSTFVFQSTSQKECTIKGNQVGSGKLYWNGYIFGDAWDFYWDVYVVPAEIKVTSISLSPTTMNLEVGKSQYISETVYPSNATNKSVSWSSSPTGIVTVSSTGEVKAIKEGTTTVTCKANDGSGKYATCKVNVSKIINVGDYIYAKLNDGIQLTFKVLDTELMTCALVGYYNSNTTQKVSLKIPSNVEGFKVVEISHDFSIFDKPEIVALDVPNTVVSIGEYNQEIKGETNVEIIPVIA